MAALLLALEWLGIGAAAILLSSVPSDLLTWALGISGIGLAVLVRCHRASVSSGRGGA